jgi:vancomycin permeability regulator SanA
MKQKLNHYIRSAHAFLLHHRKLIIYLKVAVLVSVLTLITACHFIINSNGKYVIPANSTKHAHVGLVLGAGVTKQGKPFKELQARLDVAATALKNGQVDILLLSGDNRFKNYDEPAAMVHYLEQVKHIPASKLQPDYAGRSTYESCERASKIFGLSQTIIYSAPTHLPRAIYLCRHFGIEAYGVSSGIDANNAQRRELVANVKAIFNVYIYGERTVLGKPVML